MIAGLYDKFKDWSAKGSIYIISDLHFDDIDCKLMDKNWITPEEHIKILSSYAHKNDTLIVLGDIGNPIYLSKVKSRKILIKGNHDTGSSNYKEYFDEIYEGPLFIAEKILLSHEPISDLDFCLNIHGHNHNGTMYEDPYHINVASNVCNYKPISLGEIIKKGCLSHIQTIHRETINKATETKKRKN